MTTYETKIIEQGGLKYKIQLRCISGVWQQRHIWYPAQETHVTEETADDWIRSIQREPGPTFSAVA